MSDEMDPYGKNAHEPGSKLDAGKVPVMRGLIRQFPRAVTAIAALSEFGAKKYTWNGWATVPEGQQRYADARARHEVAIGRGEHTDPDTGMLHLTAVAWNAMAELELFLREEEEGEHDSVQDAVLYRLSPPKGDGYNHAPYDGT